MFPASSGWHRPHRMAGQPWARPVMSVIRRSLLNQGVPRCVQNSSPAAPRPHALALVPFYIQPRDRRRPDHLAAGLSTRCAGLLRRAAGWIRTRCPVAKGEGPIRTPHETCASRYRCALESFVRRSSLVSETAPTTGRHQHRDLRLEEALRISVAVRCFRRCNLTPLPPARGGVVLCARIGARHRRRGSRAGPSW